MKTEKSVRYPVLLNAAIFQLAWFACVLGAAHGWSWLGPVMVGSFACFHLGMSRDRRGEGGLVLRALILGAAIDSTLAAIGLYRFESPVSPEWLAPPWLIAMWVNFSLTLRSSMGWLRGRYALAALISGVAGPAAYLAGSRLGALHILSPLSIVIPALAIAWAVAVPLLVRFAREKETP